MYVRIRLELVVKVENSNSINVCCKTAAGSHEVTTGNEL